MADSRDGFLGADVGVAAGCLLVISPTVPDIDRILLTMQPTNFRLLPYESFGLRDAARRYVIGFLAAADQMSSHSLPLAVTIVSIFIDFALRTWPPQTVLDAIDHWAERTPLPVAYCMAWLALAPFRRLRRGHRLPANVMAALFGQLLAVDRQDSLP